MVKQEAPARLFAVSDDTDCVIPHELVDRLDELLGSGPPPRMRDEDDPALAAAILCAMGVALVGASARIRLSHYVSGGGWHAHTDLPVMCCPTAKDDGVDAGGSSDATCLIYLSTCARGGETVFSLPSPDGRATATRAVLPVRGRAVAFDHSIQHLAKPAISTKRIAQFKFRSGRPALARGGAGWDGGGGDGDADEGGGSGSGGGGGGREIEAADLRDLFADDSSSLSSHSGSDAEADPGEGAREGMATAART